MNHQEPKSESRDLPRPIFHHLDALMTALKVSIIWVFVGFIIGYSLAPRFTTLLLEPLHESLGQGGGSIVFTAPLEKFWMQLRVASILGVVLAAPGIWRSLEEFLVPVLSPRHLRLSRAAAIVFYALFILGSAVGISFVLPVFIQLFLEFGGGRDSFVAMLSVYAYVNTALGVVIATGISLELPFVMLLLSLLGVVSPRSWHRWRRYAVVVNALLSTVLSPPDGLSMLLMMVPLHLLFELGVLLSAGLEAMRRRRRIVASSA